MFGASNPVVSTFTLTRYFSFPALKSSSVWPRSRSNVSPKTVPTCWPRLSSCVATWLPCSTPLAKIRHECRSRVYSRISWQADCTRAASSIIASVSAAMNSPARMCRPPKSLFDLLVLLISGQR